MKFKQILAMGLIIPTVIMTSYGKIYAYYDADAAVTYANKYAEDPNQEHYKYYPDRDCTNFVSQCLVAGGLSMRNVQDCYLKRAIIKDDEAWFHKTDGYHYLITQSWTVVDEFYWYWRRHTGATYSENYTYDQLKMVVRKGDIIQASKGGAFGHSVICTGNSNASGSYDGKKIILAYHSKDKKNVTLATFNIQYNDTKPVTYRIIRFK